MSLKSTLLQFSGFASLLVVVVGFGFSTDNDTYQSMGLDLFAFGRWPYLESLDQNFPGISLLHVIAIALFGNNELSIRIFEIAFQATSAVFILRLARRWYANEVAWLAALGYVFVYVHGPAGVLAQRDGFATLPLLIAATILLRVFDGKSRQSFIEMGCAGLCIGLAVLLRPTFLIFAVVPIALFPLSQRRNLSRILAFLAGTLTPLVLLLFCYALRKNGLEALYAATIEYNLEVYSSLKTPYFLRRAFICSLVPIIWYLSERWQGKFAVGLAMQPREKIFLICWFVAAYLEVAVMRKFFTYHFFPVVAFLSPLAAHTVDIWARALSPQNRKAVLVVAGFVLFASCYPFGLVFDAREDVASHKLNQTAEYLRASTSEYDCIEFSSIYPDLRWRHGRRSATRFTTLYPLVLKPTNGDYTSTQLVWRAEYLRDVVRNRPKFIVLDKRLPDTLYWLQESPETYLLDLPGMREHLKSAYQIDTQTQYFSIYRRRA